MNNEEIAELSCPSCTHPIALDGKETQPHCPVCGSEIVLKGHVCFACGQYFEAETGSCHDCGAALIQTCSHCRAPNWAGAEACQECGTELDIIQLLSSHHPQATMKRLDEQMREAAPSKEMERASSNKRMASLLAAERKRLFQLQARHQAERQQDRQLMATAAVVLSIFILIIATFAVL